VDPLASLDDLAAWLGQPVDGLDAARAGLILDTVSGVIRAEAGITWDGLPVPPQVVGVAVSVAGRVYRNPTGAKQQTAGPFSASGADVGGIILTDDEKAVIRSAVGNTRGLWTQSITRNDCAADTEFVHSRCG